MAASISTNTSSEERAETASVGSYSVLLASCVEILLCLFGTVGNSLTIAVICKSKSLQVVSNFLLASLAFADLLVSAVLVPMRASQHMAMYRGTTVPTMVIEIAGFIGRVNIIASISSLAAMSIDRYVALSHPIFYLSSVKFAKGQVSLAIALIWIVALIVTFLPKFPGVSDKPFLAFFVGFVLLVTLIIAVTYYKIFKIASKAIRQRRTNSRFASKVVRLSFVAALEPKLCHYVDKQQTDRDVRVQKGERKAAGTIAFVIGAFIILVYPRIILILYHFATPETTKSKEARFWIRILLYSNSVVNPPLYAWRHNEFKRKFTKFFLKCWRCCLCQKLKVLRKSSSNKTFSTHSLPRNEAHAGSDENEQNTYSVEEVNHKL